LKYNFFYINMYTLAFEITTIIAGVTVFLTFTLLLVSIILFAKARLTAAGLVKLNINGKESIEVPAGSTLLSTLSAAKIFLPSACGGGGTCAMCRCRVLAAEEKYSPRKNHTSTGNS
jgi:Na+-transporting NADH:ubiquinone oxidoreductase subunit F